MDITIRRATGEDLDFLFHLRNEESVRVSSWHIEPVDLKTHTKWFLALLKDQKRVMYIGMRRDVSVGQVRFDCLEKGNVAEVSASVSEEFRGRGYGTKILELGSAACFNDFPSVLSIRASIRLDNQASLRTFEKAGYVFEERSEYEDFPCINLKLIRF